MHTAQLHTTTLTLLSLPPTACGQNTYSSRLAALVTRVIGNSTSSSVRGQVKAVRRSRSKPDIHTCCQLTSSGPGAGCTWNLVLSCA
jgi:hypothetical protein